MSSSFPLPKKLNTAPPPLSSPSALLCREFLYLPIGTKFSLQHIGNPKPFLSVSNDTNLQLVLTRDPSFFVLTYLHLQPVGMPVFLDDNLRFTSRSWDASDLQFCISYFSDERKHKGVNNSLPVIVYNQHYRSSLNVSPEGELSWGTNKDSVFLLSFVQEKKSFKKEKKVTANPYFMDIRQDEKEGQEEEEGKKTVTSTTTTTVVIAPADGKDGTTNQQQPACFRTEDVEKIMLELQEANAALKECRRGGQK